MQAAEMFGIDPDVYFAKRRDSRMAMVAYVIGKTAIQTMQRYDEFKKAEAKASAKAKGKGKR